MSALAGRDDLCLADPAAAQILRPCSAREVSHEVVGGSLVTAAPAALLRARLTHLGGA